MPRYSKKLIRQLLAQSDAGNTHQKGRFFEDLALYLFDKFAGIRLAERNVLDVSGSQEIDLALWNNRVIGPFDILDPIIICECKNEAQPLSSAKVREFVHKLRTRGAKSGILISSSGIAGQLNGYKHASSVIMDALTVDGIKVIVIDRDEILSFSNTDDLLNNILAKYLQLTIRRTLQ
jgi:hypothetical protein